MHTLEELKQNSIHIIPGTIAYWPQHDQEEEIHPEEMLSKFNGRVYAANNSTIAFILDQEFFVTPYTRATMRILRDAGYTEASFYVPFSNWDYPKYAAERWLELRRWAQQTYLEDYNRDANEWSDKHGFNAISDEAIAKTICVPTTGLPFHSPRGYDDKYYGACQGYFLDCSAVMVIGTFRRNNGVVAFVYRDGMTYLARGYKIIPDLTAAGYKESSFFVPLSNGETITDPSLAAQWESLKRK